MIASVLIVMAKYSVESDVLPMQRVRFAIVLVVLAAAAGCYRPNFESCRIPCEPGQATCPEGMACSAGVCSAPDFTCPPGDAATETASDAPDGAPEASDASEGGADVPPDVGDDASDAAPDAPPDAPDGDSDANPDVLDGVTDANPDAPDGVGDANPDASDGGKDAPPDVGPCPAGQYRNVVRDLCVPTRDLNGDGKADLLAVNWLEHHALISNGAGFTFAKWLDGAFYAVGGALAADVTGDGYADGVGFGYRHSGVVSRGSMGFGSVAQNYTGWSGDSGLLGSKATLLADVDGDGRADVIAVFDSEISVALSDGMRFLTPTRWGAGNFVDVQATFAADADGDGLTDVIGIRPGGIAVWLSTGSSFQGEATWRTSKLTSRQGTFFADVDGDGRADGVGFDTNRIWVARSTGTAFADDQLWFDGPLQGTDGTLLADADGDGQADVISMNASNIKVALSTGTGFAPPTTWYSGQFRGDLGVTSAPAPSQSFGFARATTPAVFRAPNRWLIRTGVRLTDADVDFQFGQAGDVPVTGDWNGDGVATIGVVRPEGGKLRWLLRNANSAGPADIDVLFGSHVDGDEPVTGDWDGNGTTTIGFVHRDGAAAELRWVLRNANSAGPPDLDFWYGAPSWQDMPVVGDWNGDGTTTIGVFRPPTGEWYLRNSNGPGAADAFLAYGDALDLPVVGDWDGDGMTTVGVFRPTGTPWNTTSQPQWLLRNAVIMGPADITVSFGVAGDRPITGKWSSRP